MELNVGPQDLPSRKLRKLKRIETGEFGRLKASHPFNRDYTTETTTPTFNQIDPNSEGQSNMSVIKMNLQGKFPDLVLLDRNNGEVEKGLKMLKRNFTLSPYGALNVKLENAHNSYEMEIQWGGEILMRARGKDRCEAEYVTCLNFIKELRKTNYFIEFKKQYCPGYNTWPEFILNPSTSTRDLYRVVCLKSDTEFKYPLKGDIHYVKSEEELWKFVEDHGCSDSNADLFILNIEKRKHNKIKQICKENGMLWKHLVGCSNLGLFLSRRENPNQIKDQLLACGGENLKYRLLPPGTEKVESFTLQTGEEMRQEEETEEKPRKKAKTEEIEISQWLKDNLILMDVLDEKSCIAKSREILFCSVRDCPETEEFIVAKKSDSLGLFQVEALIDRKVVGQAQAFKVVDAKRFAAENALKNLKSCCKYIEIKKSYTGADQIYPAFLRDKHPGYRDEICWIADKKEMSDDNAFEKILKRFRNASVEDLFFLEDFDVDEREHSYNVARAMGFSVRKFGKLCVCVYKHKRPKEVYKQLMSIENKENAKYKLILPQPKSETKEESGILYKSLFDMETEETEDSTELENEKVSISRQHFQNKRGKRGSSNNRSRDNNRGREELNYDRRNYEDTYHTRNQFENSTYHPQRNSYDDYYNHGRTYSNDYTYRNSSDYDRYDYDRDTYRGIDYGSNYYRQPPRRPHNQDSTGLFKRRSDI